MPAPRHRAPKVFKFRHICADFGVNSPSEIGSLPGKLDPSSLKMAREHTVEARFHAHGKQRQVFPHTQLALEVGVISTGVNENRFDEY
jgi:hypothetical protein